MLIVGHRVALLWALTPPSNETTQAKPILSGHRCSIKINKTCQKISGENNNKKRKEDQNYSANTKSWSYYDNMNRDVRIPAVTHMFLLIFQWPAMYQITVKRLQESLMLQKTYSLPTSHCAVFFPVSCSLYDT